MEADCPWFGSKLNGTFMSLAWGRFADSGRERGFSAGRMGAPGSACREAAGTADGWSCRGPAEARGQPKPKEIKIIVSAVTVRSARAR